MLLGELISTCSHERVAEAAVISIGAAFYARIRRAARDEDISVGEFAARAVRTFRANAGEEDWHELSEHCVGKDMPILCGLHHILEMALEEREVDVCRLRRPGGATTPDHQVGACCA
ncbi:MAG: hypothetical protein JWL62_2571 [Hyphomicrobiales bacterium]|nr:hypothetical protein [Hyphomicrobiales bacterium]